MEAGATRSRDVPTEELRFNFRSDRLCLAFVATVGERWRGNYERLREPADLKRWYREYGLLDEPVAVTPTGLDTARALREAIHRVAHAVMAGRPAARVAEASRARINGRCMTVSGLCPHNVLHKTVLLQIKSA